MRPGYLQGYGEDTTRPGNFGSVGASQPFWISGAIIRTGAAAQVIGGNMEEFGLSRAFDTSASETLSGALTLSAQATVGSAPSFSALVIRKWGA